MTVTSWEECYYRYINSKQGNEKKLIHLNVKLVHGIIMFCSNIHPTRCNVTQFILSGNCSTSFGWYHNPSLGAHTTVSTASGSLHTVIAICRYRGRDGTGLSVLWVAHATHSTLKPVPTVPTGASSAPLLYRTPQSSG
jgi:hypothetical protein